MGGELIAAIVLVWLLFTKPGRTLAIATIFVTLCALTVLAFLS